MTDRKVMLYIAMSLDGYIARENNDISWLDIVEDPGEDYGYGKFVQDIDTVIMGRKTYEKVISFGIKFPYKGKKCYVISRTKTGYEESVEYYSESLEDLIADLKNKEGKDIFIDGGSEIVNELLKSNLIDEFAISIVPNFLGSGIRLFKEGILGQRIELISSKEFKTGLVQLWYRKQPNQDIR
ncbi:dihydrofolate reductase family protein [Desulfosporosinus sp. Sb-LF]|uniref:dihydrofolate reductase family protein n=1 Tax=Desulfosporosinus sp. Sb-LF TaxID=2560027 RepID=UPI00107F21BF|nr:dihydrofolate reductase family protein [Desulfosporosinus sp. Sb-LF]TGE33411.1 dihydrofolate reductase [Desulfosporosinus sp. Sb-LF]